VIQNVFPRHGLGTQPVVVPSPAVDKAG